MLEEWFLLWFLLLIPLTYLGTPIQIRFQQRMAAHPRFEVLDLNKLDPSIAQFLMSRTRELFGLGFDEPTLVHLPDAVPNVTAYLIMLVNRRAGDKATVTAVIPQVFGNAVVYVEFSTRFENGEVFNTHNIRSLLFAPPAGHVRTQVPQVEDAKQLYELHNFVMSKHGALRGKELYAPDQALDYLARVVLVQTYEEKVRRGWMYLDRDADCYRPTWKGAFLMTWGLMQPFKAVRNAAVQRRAKAILEDFAQRTMA